jgi:hypothetical protein
VCITIQTSVFSVSRMSLQIVFSAVAKADGNPGNEMAWISNFDKQGDAEMLGIIAAVLIVLWLLGFFAFHVTTAFVHVALIVGIVLLVLHLMRGRGVAV